MQRAFPNVLCADPDRSAAFYEAVLGMTRHADFGWFIILTHPAMQGLEFGLLDRSQDIIPSGAGGAPSGFMLTFVVEDLEGVVARAEEFGAEIVEAPRDMVYGQRRMVLKDPAGALVDVSAPISR